MHNQQRHKLMRIIYANPLENPLFPFRRWNALPWFQPKSVPASILFIDMSASVWSKIDDPLVWQENIYTLHLRAKKIISCCNGEVSKTIGDCAMAYFKGKNHEENAVLCATALLQSFHLLKQFFESDMDNTLWCFPVTIGVASGDVHFLYRKDPFGWPVDLAARLQGTAEAGTAVIFTSTIEAMANTELYTEIKAFLREGETVKVKSFNDVKVARLVIAT